MNDDYTKAGVPMLTVTHGKRVTRNNILGYTVLLAFVAVAVAFTSIGGFVYLAVALVLNGLFLRGAIGLWRREDEAAEGDEYKAERKFFRLSLVYLFAHFAALLVEAALRGVSFLPQLLVVF